MTTPDLQELPWGLNIDIEGNGDALNFTNDARESEEYSRAARAPIRGAVILGIHPSSFLKPEHNELCAKEVRQGVSDVLQMGRSGYAAYQKHLDKRLVDYFPDTTPLPSSGGGKPHHVMKPVGVDVRLRYYTLDVVSWLAYLSCTDEIHLSSEDESHREAVARFVLYPYATGSYGADERGMFLRIVSSLAKSRKGDSKDYVYIRAKFRGLVGDSGHEEDLAQDMLRMPASTLSSVLSGKVPPREGHRNSAKTPTFREALSFLAAGCLCLYTATEIRTLVALSRDFEVPDVPELLLFHSNSGNGVCPTWERKSDKFDVQERLEYLRGLEHIRCGPTVSPARAFSPKSSQIPKLSKDALQVLASKMNRIEGGSASLEDVFLENMTSMYTDFEKQVRVMAESPHAQTCCPSITERIESLWRGTRCSGASIPLHTTVAFQLHIRKAKLRTIVPVSPWSPL
jgi:hypothetical protein